MKYHIVLGVDIGGSGIKGGLINIKSGEMVSERHRIPTPQPATPQAVAKTFGDLVRHFKWEGTIGVGFPAIVHHGKALSASNIDQSWINTDIKLILSNVSQCPVHVLNDADAAGIAVMHYGIGKKEKGVVLILTIGTGIGSALFVDGRLVPNTELGHIFLKGQNKIAEKYTSNAARKREDLDWRTWGLRFNEYLEHVNHIFSPDLIILGGGGSKHWEKYADEVTIDTRVKPASLLNKAGAIGAARYAWLIEEGDWRG